MKEAYTGLADELAPWRDALDAGELRAPQCESCQRWSWPPRAVCSHCRSPRLVWRGLPRHARLFTWTTVHRTPLGAFAGMVPYAVGVFQFEEERVRIVGRIDSPVGLEIDQVFAWVPEVGPDGTAQFVWKRPE